MRGSGDRRRLTLPPLPSYVGGMRHLTLLCTLLLTVSCRDDDEGAIPDMGMSIPGADSTAPDAGTLDGGRVDSGMPTSGLRTIAAIQDPNAANRPVVCTQQGGVDSRSGECPAVAFDDVVVTAIEGGENGRASLFVQDDRVMDGRFAGVFVFNARLEGGTPSVGDRVNVSGIAVLFFDGMQIADATVTLLAGGNAPMAPIVVMPSMLPGAPPLSGSEVTNPYEGVLVQLENVSVTNPCVESSGDRGYFEVAGSTIIGSEYDYAYNGEAPADASSPGPCNDMPRPNDMRKMGDSFQSITGVMSYTFSQFRLNPRGDADLVR